MLKVLVLAVQNNFSDARMTVLPAQSIITLDIGHLFADQPQRLWCRDRRRRERFSIEQPVQQVEDSRA